jgi:hypothetical protein
MKINFKEEVLKYFPKAEIRILKYYLGEKEMIQGYYLHIPDVHMPIIKEEKINEELCWTVCYLHLMFKCKVKKPNYLELFYNIFKKEHFNLNITYGDVFYDDIRYGSFRDYFDGFTLRLICKLTDNCYVKRLYDFFENLTIKVKIDKKDDLLNSFFEQFFYKIKNYNLQEIITKLNDEFNFIPEESTEEIKIVNFTIFDLETKDLKYDSDNIVETDYQEVKDTIYLNLKENDSEIDENKKADSFARVESYGKVLTALFNEFKKENEDLPF